MQSTDKERYGFLHRVSEGIVSGTFVAIGSALVGWARKDPMKWLTGFHLTFLMIGVFMSVAGTYIFFQWIRSRKQETKGDPKTLGLRILKEECEYLLTAYRDLMAMDPEHVKRPLDHGSWPDADGTKQWNYTHVSLFHLQRVYRWMMGVAKISFAEMGWSSYVPFFEEVPQFITNLLPHLEKFERIMDEKISELKVKP